MRSGMSLESHKLLDCLSTTDDGKVDSSQSTTAGSKSVKNYSEVWNATSSLRMGFAVFYRRGNWMIDQRVEIRSISG